MMVIGRVWLWIAVILILAGYGLVWYADGFAKLAELLSPLNVVNWAVVVLALLPGAALRHLGKRLEIKQAQHEIVEKLEEARRDRE